MHVTAFWAVIIFCYVWGYNRRNKRIDRVLAEFEKRPSPQAQLAKQERKGDEAAARHTLAFNIMEGCSHAAIDSCQPGSSQHDSWLWSSLDDAGFSPCEIKFFLRCHFLGEGQDTEDADELVQNAALANQRV